MASPPQLRCQIWHTAADPQCTFKRQILTGSVYSVTRERRKPPNLSAFSTSASRVGCGATAPVDPTESAPVGPIITSSSSSSLPSSSTGLTQLLSCAVVSSGSTSAAASCHLGFLSHTRHKAVTLGLAEVLKRVVERHADALVQVGAVADLGVPHWIHHALLRLAEAATTPAYIQCQTNQSAARKLGHVTAYTRQRTNQQREIWVRLQRPPQPAYSKQNNQQ